MTRVFRNRAAAEAEGFHVRTGSPSQAYREVPVKNSPRIRLKYVGDVRTDLEAQLAEALETSNRLLAELCKGEVDDPSAGITGWNECHEAVSNGIAALKAFRGETK